MRLLIVTENDKASINIRENLLDMADWREGAPFEGKPSYSVLDTRMITIDQEHLYRDHVDTDARDFFGEKPETVVYLSRHRSESGQRSLTVHPIGNHGKASFGGKAKTLVPSAPSEMTGTLRALHDAAKGLDYLVSFEATHHGPYLLTPTFFIESGSDITAWSDPVAGKALAMALLKAKPTDGPVGIGVGGGHYMPRITDVALSRDVCFGHMVASYALEKFDEGVLSRAVNSTKNVEFAYFHRKALSKTILRDAERFFKSKGIRVVREDDLPPI